jgi:uncharacterized protein (DUF433 family)
MRYLGEASGQEAVPLLPARINEFPQFNEGLDWQETGVGSYGGHASHAEEWYAQCVYNGIYSLKSCVEVDPSRRGGFPVLRGTRVTVAEALGEIADSAAITEVAENFDLDPEDLRCLLNGISLCLNRPYQK